jgi:hypothetical protein
MMQEKKKNILMPLTVGFYWTLQKIVMDQKKYSVVSAAHCKVLQLERV